MRTKDESKEIRIRQKAIEIIVQSGLEKLNMKDLALACGISASTIYVYYKNRDDLIRKLSLWLRTDLLKYSIKNLTPEMSFADGLLLQWNNRFQYFTRYPQNMLANEQLRYTLHYQQVTAEVNTAFSEAGLKNFMMNARKNGELAEMPFELYWAIAFAPLYLLIEFQVSGKSYSTTSFKITPNLIKQAVSMITMALKHKNL